jgi:hypothetical protein
VIGDRWNVSDDDVARHYPCDEYVSSPCLQVWRGVTVHASRERVWPWVGQIRIAPYSYDKIDNLGRPSPQRLLKLPEPVAGEPFTTAAGRRLGRILSAEAPEQLTGRLGGTVISYVLTAQGESTRLLMKIVTQHGRWLAPALSVGDLIMARRQLLNIKGLAEQPNTSTEGVFER